MVESDPQSILVSLASSKKVVSYDELMDSLKIDSERQLEDFIIQSIYQDIIQGKLNPKERCVEFSDWSSQKANTVDLEFMQKTLGGWIEHCQSFLAELSKESEKSNDQLAEDASNEKKIEEDVEKIKKILATTGKFAKNDFGLSDSGRPFKSDAKRHKGGPMRNIMKRSNN
uniref:PCI domain-containing protein n=1 Tax=Ditylenchus dipsaci TaxID=166011 RepID=A0A915DMR2_9BILA